MRSTDPQPPRSPSLTTTTMNFAMREDVSAIVPICRIQIKSTSRVLERIEAKTDLASGKSCPRPSQPRCSRPCPWRPSSPSNSPIKPCTIVEVTSKRNIPTTHPQLNYGKAPTSRKSIWSPYGLPLTHAQTNHQNKKVKGGRGVVYRFIPTHSRGTDIPNPNKPTVHMESIWTSPLAPQNQI